MGIEFLAARAPSPDPSTCWSTMAGDCWLIAASSRGSSNFARNWDPFPIRASCHPEDV